jgi:four helix bundle protein
MEKQGVRSQESGVRRERAAARTFRDLVVWRKAHDFTLAVYRLTDGFPKRERYGLTTQLRRAAVSIPANITEGFRRRGRNDKARFPNIAQGSLEEARHYLILAGDLAYATTTDLLHRIEEVSRLLEAYTRRLLTPDS